MISFIGCLKILCVHVSNADLHNQLPFSSLKSAILVWIYFYHMFIHFYLHGMCRVYIMKYLPLPFPFKCDKCSSFTISWMYKFAKLFNTLTLAFFRIILKPILPLPSWYSFWRVVVALLQLMYRIYLPNTDIYPGWPGNNTLGVKNTYKQLGIIYCFCPLGTLEPRSIYKYTLDC